MNGYFETRWRVRKVEGWVREDTWWRVEVWDREVGGWCPAATFYTANEARAFGRRIEARSRSMNARGVIPGVVVRS